MLNKGLNSEEARHWKTGVGRLASLQPGRYSELDSESYAPGFRLHALCYSHPLNKFAYETCLTSKKALQLKGSSLQLSSIIPSADGETKRGERKNLPLSSNALNNNLIDPTPIALRYPVCQTQTERINKIKNRIDKQPYLNVDPQTKTKKFCELDEDINWEKSTLVFHALRARSTNFSPLKRGPARLAKADGSVPDRKRQGEGVVFNTYPIQQTEPYYLKN